MPFPRYRYEGNTKHVGYQGRTEPDDGYWIVDGPNNIAFTEDRDVAEHIVRALNSFGERP